MPIKFENIDTGETVAIDRKRSGKHYRAKLSAVINSSNMSINADRGQDYGWRLDPEQQALIETWEEDPDMIARVSQFTKVPEDELTHAEFLAYMLRLEEKGRSLEKAKEVARRENQSDYEARVAQLRAKTEPMAPFDRDKVATLDDFMDGTLTGDASGDKVVDEDPEPSDEKPTKKTATKK